MQKHFRVSVAFCKCRHCRVGWCCVAEQFEADVGGTHADAWHARKLQRQRSQTSAGKGHLTRLDERRLDNRVPFSGSGPLVFLRMRRQQCRETVYGEGRQACRRNGGQQ